MYETELKNELLTIKDVDHFDLGRSCACGQSFRWKPCGDGWFGVVRGRGVSVSRSAKDVLIYPCAAEDISMWIDYFDLERDYSAVEAQIEQDDRLSRCIPFASGIRVFNQEPFEALISFIISANNNIKRIAGIIDRLCELCGETAEAGGITYKCFPTPEAIASLQEEELVKIGSGYRAPFIKASATRIRNGYELEQLRDMPLNEARKELLVFEGVGPKVADCVLLFSLGHSNAFPIDVWIGRAMRALFFDNEQPTKQELTNIITRLGPLSGIVQQYIFQYARVSGIKC